MVRADETIGPVTSINLSLHCITHTQLTNLEPFLRYIFSIVHRLLLLTILVALLLVQDESVQSGNDVLDFSPLPDFEDGVRNVEHEALEGQRQVSATLN